MPESDPLLQREKFAVSLRKEKKKQILDMRRKKTYDMMSKQKCAIQWPSSGNASINSPA